METYSGARPAKASLRVGALARRDAVTAAARAEASAAIAERAIAIAVAARPACLAAYLPIRSECDPGAIVDWALAAGVAVALPAVADATTIVFRRYRPGEPLSMGGFGTLSPTSDAPLVDPDFIVSPMTAFDRSGARLGYGRGYYDRAIAALRGKGRRPLLVGAAFAVQEVSAIPTDAHDARLDWIVTENETLQIRPES